ncbi:thiol reductant ABC exporter subunit CydD [Sporolactobacillus vineae]|uniref:thiol reductant ABC exporter subunit CydD n=1 Tax=Sporolactobacillus vineae TaxID=444463 RepID=UPI0002882056|nr:thiol reductant ABC exporter subunit CydD [Sporolactobacillus vineae]
MDREIFTYHGAKLLFFIVSVLTGLEGIFIIVQAVMLAGVISGLFSGQSVFSLENQTVLFFLAVVLRYFCKLAIKSLTFRFADRTGSEMRNHFLATVFTRGLPMIKEEGTATLVSLAIEGVPKARKYLELYLPKMAANGILPIMILCFVATKDMLSAVILLVTIPVLILFMILLGLAAQKKMDERWASYRVLSNHFLDSLRGLPTLRYLGLSRAHETSIRRVSDKYRQMTMRTLSLAFLSSFALDFFTMLSIAFVAVALGLRLINGQILLDPALVVLILAPEYFLPVRELGQDYHATLDGKEAAHKLTRYAGDAGTRFTAGIEPPDDGNDSWSAASSLSFQTVSATYARSDGEKVLDSLSFTLNGFEKIGIIGASGAGKSTLINLISGFISPLSGQIRIDGKPATLTASAWQKQITYIPQHPYLFSGSIGDNVAFYAPEATAPEIRRAVQAAGLGTFVSGLPMGLDERIGSGGRALSGGQEQRVALARAFLCRRPILLLDEPTAHLDIETEYALKESMIPLFDGKLVILATHRLHWMDQMDRILVIEHGRLQESGTQEELLKRQGAYTKLVRTQLEGLQ